MPPPFSTAWSWLVSPARITLAPRAGVGDQVGQVRAGQHRGLVDDQQGARADRDRPAGAAAAGQVAEELGGVVGPRDPGGEGVPRGLRRRDPDHRAQPGLGPGAGGLGQHAGLARSGRGVDHRDEPAVGQRRERGGGLVLAQPGPRAPRAARARACRPARRRVARRRRRARARPARAPCAARRPRGLARACVLPWPAARAWRTGCRRAAGRRCARPRAASSRGTSAGSGASRQVTGSNSEASARSARSSSSAAAAAGSMPVRGRTRPRYLITSARVHALLSCWASASAFCAARASSTRSVPGRVRRARARPRAALAVPDRRRDRRQRHAEGARELVRPARVRLREIQRAVLGRARGEVRRLRELRELALGRRAAVPLLEPRRAAAQVRGDGLAAGGEHAHHLAADPVDLEPVAVVAGGPFQAEPGGQRFLQVLRHDRGDRADVLVVAQGIRRPPLPVRRWSWRCGRSGNGRAAACRRRGRCAAASAPPPGRLRATGRSPGHEPGCSASRSGCSRPPAGSSRTRRAPPARSSHPPRRPGRPSTPPRPVPCLAGQAGVLAEGGMEDRD